MAWGRRAQGSLRGLKHTMQLTASYECKTYDNASGGAYISQEWESHSKGVLFFLLLLLRVHYTLTWGSRDERMASILSKNIDPTNILSRVGICAGVSVGAIVQRYAS